MTSNAPQWARHGILEPLKLEILSREPSIASAIQFARQYRERFCHHGIHGEPRRREELVDLSNDVALAPGPRFGDFAVNFFLRELLRRLLI